MKRRSGGREPLRRVCGSQFTPRLAGRPFSRTTPPGDRNNRGGVYERALDVRRAPHRPFGVPKLFEPRSACREIREEQRVVWVSRSDHVHVTSPSSRGWAAGSSRAGPRRLHAIGDVDQCLVSLPALMAIRFAVSFAVADFGMVTVSTPFLNHACAFSSSTSKGNTILRWKRP